MSGGIKVDSRELEAALDKLRHETASMPEAWAAAGEAMLPGIRQRTPVRSGAAAASWEAHGAGDRVEISSSLPYAGVIEAVNAPVADTLAADERALLEALEAELARIAARIGFDVKR